MRISMVNSSKKRSTILLVATSLGAQLQQQLQQPINPLSHNYTINPHATLPLPKKKDRHFSPNLSRRSANLSVFFFQSTAC
jgi:hypothetical protein